MNPPHHWTSRLALLRRRLGSVVFDNFFRGLGKISKLHPGLDASRYGVEVIRDIPYWPSGHSEHLLDIYRPRDADRPLPVVLYTHGGGFRILSKESHHGMALQFARHGYVVANINYRLAPEHAYPSATADACRAYAWVVDNASSFGGDPSRLVVTGESAGGNLAAALTVAACYERPEPFARRVWETGVVPRASVPACGVLQVSNSQRFARRPEIAGVISDRIVEVEEAYLDRSATDASDDHLADPLLILESEEPDRPLPPFYTFAGTADPLLDDARRLEAALDERGVPCRASYIEGQPHAFHCLIWTPDARRVWREKLEFLEHHVERSPVS